MKCDRSNWNNGRANWNKDCLLLYGVTDRAWTGQQSLLEQVESALQGGATCIQLREKDLEEEAFLAEAVALKALCQRYSVPFIVNDNVEVAIKSGANGIHVGQEDLEAARVRQIMGEEVILGVSVKTVEQALLAQSMGADYLGVGAVFPTATKADAEGISRETLKAICQAVSIPVVAIGGIDSENMGTLASTGIAGVALVSAIFKGEDIEGRCRSLRLLAEKTVGEGMAL